jgi:hypothetical protein
MLKETEKELVGHHFEFDNLNQYYYGLNGINITKQ